MTMRPLARVVVVLLALHVFAHVPTGLVVVTPAFEAAAQDAMAVEASLGLDRPVRRLIQQGLRSEGFDPGVPDGVFGPRTRRAIRAWQQSRGASSTGYLTGAEVALLQAAAAPAAAVPEPAPPAEEILPSALSAAQPPASTVASDSLAERASAADPGGGGETRGAVASGDAQLPPEILVDRHLVRAERLLAAGDVEAALEEMNAVLTLREAHDLALGNEFHFEYAQVTLAAGLLETAIASLNEYLLAAGREGEFYREALHLLDSAEVRLQREQAERRRLARWPPGEVFRDCDVCPEMVVLPGSVLALGRYEVTAGEYGAFVAATGGGGDDCSRGESWRDPGFGQTDRHPVVCVSWDDAQAYLSWLSQATGATYRLPTEAEWQRAAVGSQPGCYSDRTEIRGTCPVGSYGANRLGLSDMAGNVSEWTEDCSERDCVRRVLRGSTWVDSSRHQGLGKRDRFLIDGRSPAGEPRMVLD